MSLPEGLHLTYGISGNFEPEIIDGQDMTWVVFPDHDTEDPISWFTDIMLRTCRGLGVKDAINERGELLTVPEFIAEWTGWHEDPDNPGFTT